MEAARAVAQRNVLIVEVRKMKVFVGPEFGDVPRLRRGCGAKALWETGRLMIGIAAGEKRKERLRYLSQARLV